MKVYADDSQIWAWEGRKIPLFVLSLRWKHYIVCTQKKGNIIQWKYRLGWPTPKVYKSKRINT